MGEHESSSKPITIAEVASEGGRARAESLSPEERRAIAKKGADARWNADLPKATHEGTLHIAGLDIPCSVLAGGIRVLSERGIAKALGKNNRNRRGVTDDGTRLPSFVSASNLKPFIRPELESVLVSPIIYQPLQGGRAHGIQASVLPEICDVWLQAKSAKVLSTQQQRIADRAYTLLRGFAHVGIIALVDEATGYQEIRDKMALQEILDKYLRKDFAAWAKRFPEEFYQEIFRLRGWQWKGMKVNRPQCVAGYTIDLVYSRLLPGIVKELESRNPKDGNGYRKARHHQFFTDDVGHPALAQHLKSVVDIMRGYDDWKSMTKHMDRALPKQNQEIAPLFAMAMESEE